ncbi:hypothetical protein SORBI_3009G112101 [Sorghum bicolor]|uniref:Uncharacterized protein n=1 Tax=Sorghum bicolor TaxID=4558 RepID=A0A1B6P7X1_SORBI|nr:hypothetical protein SORBI_3009G112101 [Sorghum bicolor]
MVFLMVFDTFSDGTGRHRKTCLGELAGEAWKCFFSGFLGYSRTGWLSAQSTRKLR